MPRSQTPVVSCLLALAATGLLPSDVCISSALGPVAWPCPLSTIIHFSEFDYAACVLASPLLRTVLFNTRSSVRLPTRWLAFGRVGLEYSSHPLGNIDMFQEVSPLFPRPEFSSARAAGLLVRRRHAGSGRLECWRRSWDRSLVLFHNEGRFHGFQWGAAIALAWFNCRAT